MIRTIPWLLWLVAACNYGINIDRLKPDAGREHACLAGPDQQSAACRLAGHRVCRDHSADWTVVVPSGATYQDVELSEDLPLTGAATLDWDDPAGRVAGFLLTLPVAGSAQAAAVAAKLTGLVQGSGGFATVEVDDSGRAATSHDGHPMLARTALTLSAASSTTLAEIRNRLFPALTGLDISQFPRLPASPKESSDRFKLVFSTILRPDGRAVVMGGVATLDSYGNLLGKARLRAEDLASGTLVAAAAARTTARCETLPFVAPAALDFLWVVSGSDSETMSNARVRLHGAAVELYSRARSYAIDLRVAVVDMSQTKEVRFCTPKPSADCPAPGAGHFFGDSDTDLACFQACLLQPSGTKEPELLGRGLESARNTLLSLLSRSDTDPHKLRQSAQPVVLFAADVEDQGIAALFGGNMPDPLSTADRARVDAAVDPLVNLLSTSPGSELSGTVAYGLVVDPQLDPSCPGRRGTGYIELVQRLGRQHDSLCQAQTDLETLLESRVDALAPLASLLRPQHPAVSATLSASLNGSAIFRSLSKGFDYDADHGVLLLHDLRDDLLASGNRIELSYVGW